MKDLLLLHGALGHTDQFKPYLPWLEQHFRVHTFLFGGHGGTPIPEGGIRMQTYVNQLAEYIAAHRLQDIAVFGYSMGGYAALCHTLQYPGVITSLLTLATKLSWTEEGALREAKMLQPAALEEKVPKYAAQLAAQHGADHWKLLLPAIAGMMTDLGREPLLKEAAYPRISASVQLMVGDKDNMVSIEETLAAARAIPEARFAVIPGTRHPLEQVRPSLLPGLMKDFWNL